MFILYSGEEKKYHSNVFFYFVLTGVNSVNPVLCQGTLLCCVMSLFKCFLYKSAYVLFFTEGHSKVQEWLSSMCISDLVM